uniref:Uncharacterized protein n=1 Tax=Anopheles farauti TaxID=69004 RepID=A0A182Q4J7_9DIPT
MEYVPLRAPAAETYHYHHVTDQTKSLQDLQNEVAALLEFRDLVIETFPDLKSKMASSAANSTLTGLHSNSSLGSRREWEPGIRIRRKLTQKETGGISVVGCADGVGGGGGSSGSITGGGSTSSTTIITAPSTAASGSNGSGGNVNVTVSSTATGTTTITSGSVSSSSSAAAAAAAATAGTHASDLNHHHAHHHHHHHHHHTQHGGSSGGGGGGTSSSSNPPHSSSSLIRSRSNSHSGKKEPKSGEGNNGSVIQDSGFSTETSSSKETHSAASSTSGAVQGTLILPTTSNRQSAETGGELWNLLDVIHRKSSRLREEVEQHLEREKSRATNLAISNHHQQQQHGVGVATNANDAGNNIVIHHSNPAVVASGESVAPTTVVVSAGGTAPAPAADAGEEQGHHVQILRKLRDQLLDKLSECEAETTAGRIQNAKLQDELELLTRTIRDLQKQLTVANNHNQELSSKLHDLHLQSVHKSAPSSPESIKLRQPAGGGGVSTTHGEEGTAAAKYGRDGTDASSYTGLGRLDKLFVAGAGRVPKVRTLDTKKFAAILLETNVVELQRQLLQVIVQNQVLQQQLDQATRSRLFLSEKFERSKEDLDDLRFQLKEKSIELEGTKAQLRVIESKASGGGNSRSVTGTPERIVGVGFTAATTHLHQHPPTGPLLALRGEPVPAGKVSGTGTIAMRSQVSTPSMKAMIPVAMDDIAQPSSSTESTQDRDSIGGERLLQQQQQQQNQQAPQAPETPRRRPSKIPLGTGKGTAAPKPPTGRNFSATPSPTQRAASTSVVSSGPPSNRSLTKSTGSLYVKSADTGSFGQLSSSFQQAPPPPSAPGSTSSSRVRTITTTTTTTTPSSTASSSAGSLYRASSALSWRTSKDTPSLERLRSSSIPVVKAGGGAAPPPTSPAGGRKSSALLPPPPPVPPPQTASPQPARAKRDSLTSRVKNCDSLSRLQSAQSVPAVGKPGTARKEPSASPPTPPLATLRHTSIGSTEESTGVVGGSTSATLASSATTPTSTSGAGTNTKARRNDTFRLTKPTVLQPLLATTTTTTTMTMTDLPDMAAMAATTPLHRPVVGRVRSQTQAQPSDDGAIVMAPVRSACSTSALYEPGERRRHDLIGEYLAAKSRTRPPPIFPVRHPAEELPDQRQRRQYDALAYKHPHLLMVDDEDDDGDDEPVETNAGQESLIVPRPKVPPPASTPAAPTVGRINPNILKTWEQLSGGRFVGGGSRCVHQHERRRRVSSESSTGSSNTTTSGGSLLLSSTAPSEDERQSCLLYCPGPGPGPNDELLEFTVQRVGQVEATVAAAAAAATATATPPPSASIVTDATTRTTSSDGGANDFYDSIDAASTCLIPGKPSHHEPPDQDEVAGGEALAEPLTSLDRKRMLWSIEID